jgi:hypothetical protein
LAEHRDIGIKNMEECTLEHALECTLAELICSPMDALEEIVLNENSSIKELEQILPVLDDIINNGKSLYSTVVDRIKRIKFSQLDKGGLYITKYYPIFYAKGELIGNKYMMSKFNGLPFMRQREAWPKNKKGAFLKFLCQIIHPNDPNILYRIFVDEGEIDSNSYTILPIILATSKWLKSTAMAFKEMTFDSNEYIIKEWIPYTELKEYKYIKEYISEEDYNIMANKLILPPLMNPTKMDSNIQFGEKLYLLQLEKNNILLI